MENWRKFAQLLLLVGFFFCSFLVHAKDSAHWPETSPKNVTTIIKLSGGGGRGGGGSEGGGGGGRSAPAGGGDEGSSNGGSKSPGGRLLPLIGAGAAHPRDNEYHRNAASSRFSCSLGIALINAALGAAVLACV